MKSNIFRIVFIVVLSGSVAERSLFDTLASGFKLAGKLLGVNHVSDISQLISNAFKEHKIKDDKTANKENVFSGFLRILGFDSKKIAAIGVNGIILLAQLISSSLTKPQSNQNENHQEFSFEDPLTWISTAPGIQNTLEHSKKSDLSNSLIEYIKEHSLDEDTGCLQQLICKLSPFVKKMQNYVNAESKETGKSALFNHLPSIEDIRDMGNICEERHPYCRVIY